MLFAEYMGDHRPALMRFATVLTGQTWLAEDLVSDVLDRAYERWGHIGQLEQPHAYVRRMVVNEHLSWRRRGRWSAPHEDTAELGDHFVVVPDVADAVTERDAMIARLDRLPRRQRAALVLRYYAGLTDDEIAAELGCRASTVRSQISRALRTLRLHDPDNDADPEATSEPPGPNLKPLARCAVLPLIHLEQP